MHGFDVSVVAVRELLRAVCVLLTAIVLCVSSIRPLLVSPLFRERGERGLRVVLWCMNRNINASLGRLLSIICPGWG